MKLPLVSVVPAMKLVPAMVMVVSPDPAMIEDGVSELILGPLTVNTLAAEAAALVFFTTTFSAPAVAIAVAGTVTVIDVAVPAVATSGVVLEPR